MQKKGGQKIAYLEGLRGIAAAMVVLYHFFAIFFPVITTGPSSGPEHSRILERLFFGPPLGFLQNGSFAVVIFFLLSGFVLSYGFFKSKTNNTLISQSLKRYFRLVVPVFTSIMLGYALLFLQLFKNQEVASITGSIHFISLWNFTPNLQVALYTGIIGVFTEGRVEYNPVLWTMPIEFLGSFFIFFFLALFGKYKYRGLFYFLAFIFTWSLPYSAFLVGMILCDIYCSDMYLTLKKIVSQFSTTIILGMLVIIGGSVPAFCQDLGIIKYSQVFYPLLSAEQSSYFWHLVAATALLLIVLTSARLQLLLSRRPFVYLGRISFAVYILHYFIYATITAYIFLALYSKMPYWQVTLICFTVSFPVIGLIAGIWTRLIDGRAVVFSRYFADRYRD